jgi:hypothetical protein
VIILPAKKKGPSNAMKALIVLMLSILILSIAYVLIPKTNIIPSPSPSSFREQVWMETIPSGAEYFRFINVSALINVQGLFVSDDLLSLSDIGRNISISDVEYLVRIYPKNNTLSLFIALNHSFQNEIQAEFDENGIDYSSYKNYRIYNITSPLLSGNFSWLCFADEGLIYSDGGDQGLFSIMSVLDSSSYPFFNNDQLKISYLLASKNDKYFFFEFLTGENQLNIEWKMKSAYNSTLIQVNEDYHFVNQTVLETNIAQLEDLLPENNGIFLSENNVIVYYSWPQSDLTYVIMGG